MAYLELKHVRKVFGETVAVEDFTLDIQQGEFVSFLGSSGCGKTTTLRMIAGFELPTSGTITLNGRDVTFTPPNRRNVGMVFQSYALFPNMTVAQNVGYGLRVAGKPKAEIDQRVREMLALIQMEKFAARYPSQLSGGQQQRVALARALAIRPQVLLLDEPLSALDAKIRVELRQEIRRIQQELRITAIYVTHDQEEALSLSDRVVVMSQGRIEQVGTPTEIYNNPASEFVARFIGHINLLPVHLVSVSADHLSVRFGSCMLRVVQPEFSPNGAAPMLAIRPETIRLGTGSDQDNRLVGRVESVTYLGAVIRLQVHVEGHSLSVDVLNERTLSLPRQGEDCPLHFSPRACWLMPSANT
ncbi:MAG: ABC transporter ATP-binding protein [Anaerolineae bacterium]|nr:ABC transporter ATP-binding protein [Thermoflexales bacterium]MDW8396048.1 ABC transporter ATP-binding protein [Anaerolineae bacterium]